MELLKQGDKLDRYRAHLLAGRSLNDEELKQLSRYRKAYGLLSAGYSRLQVVTVMQSDPMDPLSESQMYRIVADSMKLYARLDEVDKKAERAIAYENYKLLANLARSRGDLKAALKAQELADKIMGLFTPDAGGLDPKLFLKPTTIVFTTDIQALKDAARAEETEDVDYEDAE